MNNGRNWFEEFEVWIWTDLDLNVAVYYVDCWLPTLEYTVYSNSALLDGGDLAPESRRQAVEAIPAAADGAGSSSGPSCSHLSQAAYRWTLNFDFLNSNMNNRRRNWFETLTLKFEFESLHLILNSDLNVALLLLLLLMLHCWCCWLLKAESYHY